MTDYADLEIRIRKREADGYPVEITLNHDVQYERGLLSPELPTGDGEHLFAWLFANGTLHAAWEHARGQHPQRAHPSALRCRRARTPRAALGDPARPSERPRPGRCRCHALPPLPRLAWICIAASIMSISNWSWL